MSGHVYCADTNAPARLAKVLLKPINIGQDESQNKADNSISLPGTTTDLDGAFQIDNVPAGEYYVYAVLPGYLDESTRVSGEPQKGKDSTSAAPVAEKATRVSVTANVGGTAELRIERAGTLSGSIRYDDGTPVADGTISILNGWGEGEPRPKLPTTVKLISPFLFDQVGAVTDDRGRFRISGVPEGRYSLKVTLAAPKRINYSDQLQWVDDSGNQMVITVFLGDTLHWNNAHTVTLGTGEERTGLDITVPVSGFHSIAGVVEAKSDGHRINAGTVRLVGTDDQTFTRDTRLQPDGGFEFDLVPAGTYTVSVENAKDSKGRITQAGGRAIYVIDTLQKFGPAKIQIVLQATDVTDVVLAVPVAEAE